MLAKVLAYKHYLIMVPLSYGECKDFVPTRSGNLGTVICHSEKNLGVSEEALALMRSMGRNNDCIGDIGWWSVSNGTHAFSWFGSLHRVIDVNEGEGSRDFTIYRDCCEIVPNEVTEEMKQAIDQKLYGDGAAWKDKYRIEEMVTAESPVGT